MKTPTQTNHTPGGLPYKWTVVIVVILGLFMPILDITIVNIAIPRLQSDFGAPLTSIQWVATGYTLAEGMAIPLTPFLSELLGLKQFYLIGIAGFTLCSALCGLAWSLPALVAHLVEQVTATSPTGALLQQLTASFTANAPSQEAATAAAVQEIINLLMSQANMLAIDDAFVFTLAITIAAIVLTWLIPIPPQPKGTAKSAPMG